MTDADKLVERLRKVGAVTDDSKIDWAVEAISLCREAADALAQQQERLAEAERGPINGEIIGKNSEAHRGFWSGAVWLDPGDVLIRVNRPEAAARHGGKQEKEGE